MRMSDNGLRNVASWEGFRAQSYLDAADLPTIGYGHLIKGSEGWLHSATLTEEEAILLMVDDVGVAEAAVNVHVTVPLTQCQFDALVSFTFNVGVSAFRTSTLLKKLNQGKCEAVPHELMRWTYIKKAFSKGLESRRRKEARMWAGDYGNGVCACG